MTINWPGEWMFTCDVAGGRGERVNRFTTTITITLKIQKIQTYSPPVIKILGVCLDVAIA